MKTKIIYEDKLFVRVEYSDLSEDAIKAIFDFVIENQTNVLNVHMCKGYANIAHFTINQMKDFLKLSYNIHEGFNKKFYLTSKFFITNTTVFPSAVSAIKIVFFAP